MQYDNIARRDLKKADIQKYIENRLTDDRRTNVQKYRRQCDRRRRYLSSGELIYAKCYRRELRT